MPAHQKIIHFLLPAFLLVGCSGQAISAMTSPAPVVTSTSSSVEEADLGSFFQGLTGAFVLYDLSSNQTLRYNLSRCAEQFLPFSTFKILNALIGLETGVIPDENYVIPWDGTLYPNASWNKDQSLKSAIKNSVVWYYQELARRVGHEKMQQYVTASGYGNQDISGQIDNFWLSGGLRISADEQVAFLQRLVQNDLPFSQRAMQIVRDIIVLEKTGTYQLSGKTGSGKMGQDNVSWFVGYLDTKDHVYFFATNITGNSPDTQAAKARGITQKILQSMGLLP